MATDPKKKAQTKVKNQAKKQVKKAARRNPVAFILVVVALVVIIVGVTLVLYFKVPAVHDAIENIIHPETASTDKGGTNSGGSGGSANPDLVTGEGDLKVHFMDVGQGDGIYIQFPDGTDMLIDCGNKSSGYDYNVTKAYLDALNPDGAITHLMLTHGDEDHVDQMGKIIAAYQISNIYMPNILAKPTDNPKYGKSGNEKLTAKCDETQKTIDELPADKLAMFKDPNTLYSDVYCEFFIAALTEENCRIVLNVDEDKNHNSIVISDNSTYELKFYCMTVAGWAHNTLKDAHEKNEVSPVGVLSYNGKRIVLTGDSNEENEPEMAERIGNLDCDVLKVGHHGSETSSMPVFLDAITCEYAVISCKMDGNTFYHPRQTTLDRLIARGYTIYRTDLNGTIVLTVDKNGTLNFVTQKQATKEQEENGLTNDEIAEIKEYKKKLDNGEITQEEYDAKHAEIVGW